jgi:hypothetical protein
MMDRSPKRSKSSKMLLYEQLSWRQKHGNPNAFQPAEAWAQLQTFLQGLLGPYEEVLDESQPQEVKKQ